jgi:hypothetical protein
MPLPQAMPQIEEISFDDLPPELQDIAGAGWTTFEGEDVATEAEPEGEDKPAES